MNLCLSSPLNKYELAISLSSLFLFSRKMEVIYGSRYIFLSYLIVLVVTSLSFLPCNVGHKLNMEHLSNPNALNFAFSQIIFMKYRMEHLNSILINLAYISVFIYLILPEGYSEYHEVRNIILSAVVTSAIL